MNGDSTCILQYQKQIDGFPSCIGPLLKQGDFWEIDPDNFQEKQHMHILLFENDLIFTEYKKGSVNDPSNLKMDYIYKLSEIVLYVVENAVISLESAQGLPLMPHGHTKRYFKLSDSSLTSWVTILRHCNARIESIIPYKSDLPDVLENQEFDFNTLGDSPRLSEHSDVPDRPHAVLTERRPRSYSMDPELYSGCPQSNDLALTLHETTTSDESSTASEHLIERVSKRPLHRSRSVDNTPYVENTPHQTLCHSLPTNFKNGVKKKGSNSKFYHAILNKLSSRTKESCPPCHRHMIDGTRFARPSPELGCRNRKQSDKAVLTHDTCTKESEVSILTLKPVHVAQELTSHMAVMLQNIMPSELRKRAWTMKNKEELAPNIDKMIEFFNWLFNKISIWILEEDNVEKRAKIIKRLIVIADECRNLNNFESVYTIVSCLESTPIYRLKETWALIKGRNKMKVYTNLRSLVHSSNKFCNYRQALSQAKRKGHYIPMLPVFLNQVEHSRSYLKNTNTEDLAYIDEDSGNWKELSSSMESEKGQIRLKDKGSFKWLKKSTPTSPSPLPLHIEQKLRDNVQSILEQNNESIDDTQIMMENTPHYLLRSHQKHSAGYNLPPYPLIASFLSLPFNKDMVTCKNWKELDDHNYEMSCKLEPPPPTIPLQPPPPP